MGVISFLTFCLCLFAHSDPFNKIPALDPEKLKVFSTVQEITGKHSFIAESLFWHHDNLQSDF